MTPTRSLSAFALVATALLLSAAARPAVTDARRHLALVKSAPAADSVVSASPAAIKLWFSERVELGASRARLEGPDAKPVSIGTLTQEKDAADAPVVATITGALTDGAYTVSWTASSKDGHVVKGSFGFTVRTR